VHSSISDSRRWFVVAVLAACLIPLAGLWLPLDIRRAVNENRPLAGAPDLTWKSWRTWPARFEAYYDDHFGLRNFLIRAHNYIQIVGLRRCPNRQVILGKHDSYFLMEHLSIFQRPPFSAEELESWARLFTTNANEFAMLGGKYYLVLVPATPTIYPEYIPDEWRKPEAPTLLDQLIVELNAAPNLEIIDVRSELSAARSKEPTHLRTDYHWSDYGAFVSYAKIVRTIQADFPNTSGLSSSDLVREPFVKNATYVTKLLGMDGLITEPAVGYRVKSPAPFTTLVDAHTPDGFFGTLRVSAMTSTSDRPTAALIGDSFTVELYPYLRESFSRLAYFLARGGQTNLEFMRGERPQVVIHVLCESKLGWGPVGLMSAH
jgi:alginate O-acetyltransferase complex protein AlgJ